MFRRRAGSGEIELQAKGSGQGVGALGGLLAQQHVLPARSGGEQQAIALHRQAGPLQPARIAAGEVAAQAEVSYAHDGWFAKLAAHYTSERFFTYTNDQKVPATTLVELSAGYRFDQPGVLNGLELQVNVTNLFDKSYVSTVGSNGFGYSGDSQTLLAGAPRQTFVTVRKTF